MIKRKLIFYCGVTLVLMVVAAGIAVVATLRGGTIHRFVLAKMVEKASQATGARVELGNFQFRWSGLQLDLYQLVLHGTEPAAHAPLLKVDHLMVGLKINSLWRHKIDVGEIAVDRPSLHMTVERNGRSNLPQGPPAAPGSHPMSVFDLAIGKFVVSHGELDYNNRQIPLDGEVCDLQAQVNFDSSKTEYDGTLEYRDGRLQFGSLAPVKHGLQAHFGVTPSGLTLSSVKLETGASTISLEARLQNYANPSVDGSYQAHVSTRELGEILKVATMPFGLVNLQGTLRYNNHPGSPLIENLLLAGRAQSPVMAINLPQAHTSVRGLTGEYRLSNGILEAQNVKASMLGGRISGSLTLTQLTQRPVARVVAAAHDVSLEALSSALGSRPLEASGVGGNVNGTMEGSWVGGGQNLKIRTDATVASSVPPLQGGAAPHVIPLQGDLHLAYDGRSGVISVTHSELTGSHLSLKLDGSTGRQSRLSIRAQSDDLRQVDQLVLIVRHATAGPHPTSSAPIAPLSLAGSGSFDGQLDGSMSNLQLTGQVNSSTLQYHGATVSELRAIVALSPSGLALSKGQLRTGEHGQIHFEVSAGMANWAYTPQSPVQLNINAQGVAVTTIEQFASLHYPISGTLAAQVSMHGSQSDPIGQGSATLTQATVWGQPVQNLSVQFQGAGSTVRSTLQLSTPAGSASGKLSYNLHSQGYEGQFNLPKIQLERLGLLHYKALTVSGIAAASLQGRGTLKEPELTADIQAPKLTVGQQTLDSLKLHADIARQRASFTLDSSSVGASIQARGDVSLNASYPADATLDVRNIQLGALMAAFLPQVPPDVSGHAELHGTLHGPLKNPEQLEAEIDVPTLNLTYRSLQIGNASPLRAVYRSGVFSLDRCELKGPGSGLRVEATVPLKSAGNLRASASGNLDLHLLQMLYPDWNSSGQLRLDVAAQGTFAHPQVNGTVHVVDAAFLSPNAPLGAEKVNASLAISSGRVDIQSFTAEAGGGTVSVEGFATYQPAIQFNMTVTAKSVRLRYPVGTRAILDGDLALTGSRDSALISGRVLIDRLSLTKDFDLSTFADQFTGSSSASTSSEFARNVKLNVSLTSASEMALASSKLSVQGSADLMVRGTAAEPVILGRSDITGGEIFFNGNRYVVENGVIQFVNPMQTEPVVNILVTTTVDQFNLSMNFVGPIDRLRTTYTSDPPLAPIDIINLLATGQTTEASTTTTSSPESVVAGQLTSQFSSRVEKLAGITSLTIDPQVGGQQGNGVGRLAVQQRVTKNLFFTFSTDLTTSTGSIVQVEYQVSKKYSVSTIRDQNGGYTLEVKVRKRF